MGELREFLDASRAAHHTTQGRTVRRGCHSTHRPRRSRSPTATSSSPGCSRRTPSGPRRRSSREAVADGPPGAWAPEPTYLVHRAPPEHRRGCSRRTAGRIEEAARIKEARRARISLARPFATSAKRRFSRRLTGARISEVLRLYAARRTRTQRRPGGDDDFPRRTRSGHALITRSATNGQVGGMIPAPETRHRPSLGSRPHPAQGRRWTPGRGPRAPPDGRRRIPAEGRRPQCRPSTPAEHPDSEGTTRTPTICSRPSKQVVDVVGSADLEQRVGTMYRDQIRPYWTSGTDRRPSTTRRGQMGRTGIPIGASAIRLRSLRNASTDIRDIVIPADIANSAGPMK